MSPLPATRQLAKSKPSRRDGRGRRAAHPFVIPRRGWKDILWRTWFSLKEDRVGLAAAGVAFYLLLSIVPALTATLSVYGIVSDSSDVADQVQAMQGVVPEAVLTFLEEEMRRLINSSNLAGLGLLFSILLGLWGASRAHQAIGEALDLAYGERSSRGLIMSRLRAIALAAMTACTGLVAIGLLVVGPHLVAFVGWEDSEWVSVFRWPLAALVFWSWLTLVYRFGPSRRPAKWRWLSLGSLLATIMWLAVSALLAWYAANLVDMGKAYGSLGGVALLLIWLFGFAFALLLGAEFDSEIEHQVAKDTTVGPERPLGERGAFVADTVGRAKGADDSWFEGPPAEGSEGEDKTADHGKPSQ